MSTNAAEAKNLLILIVKGKKRRNAYIKLV